jgi:hypothetical protein
VTSQVTDGLRQRSSLRRRRCRGNAGPERTGRTQGSVSVQQELHEATALPVFVLFCLRFGLYNVSGTCLSGERRGWMTLTERFRVSR